VLLTYVTAMVNASLRDGRLPASQKTAITTPLLKKPSLDAGDLKSYRPVSNLTFMSKVVETREDRRWATCRILAVKRSDAAVAVRLPPLRRHHSMETALLRVLSDIFCAADCQHVTLLGLLDLSAAFDCVDHNILIRRL